MLAAGLAVTALAKLLIVRVYEPEKVVSTWTRVLVGDVLFFLGVLGAIRLAYACHPLRLISSLAVLVAVLVLAWSGLNAAWLLATGAQLQLGAFFVILRYPAEFWPNVQPYLVDKPLPSLVGGALTLPLAAWAVWRAVRPPPVLGCRSAQLRRAAVLFGLLIVLWTADQVVRSYLRIAWVDQVLDYSSHWCAVTSAFGTSKAGETPAHQSRYVPRAGEREVGLPPFAAEGPTNVVLVLLESVSYKARQDGTPECSAMPFLGRLAGDGVEFTTVRATVPQTACVFWSVLSGTTPDVQHNSPEAVLVDRPYEGLPTLLGRLGYRSAFFQMAKGAFQGTPGTFANFGFDWAWFRENLEDPSADLSYMAGDDFRMLGPAFEWVTRQPGPFLLMMITSACHYPYNVPEWFGAPASGNYEKYLQALRYTDAFVEEVMQRLRQHGLAERTLVCILGDHGESFRADSRKARWVPYEELLRVPWLLYWPGRLPAGVRHDWPCSQMDVTPTILSLLGYDISRAGFEGCNAMMPTDPQRRFYFACWYRGSPSGYTEGVRKLVYWPQNEKVFEFDLAADPEETSPVPVNGALRDQVIADLESWARDSRLEFDAKRFRKRFLYDHWWVMSTGHNVRACYVP